MTNNELLCTVYVINMFEWTINQTVINNKLLRMKNEHAVNYFLIIWGESKRKFKAHKIL